MNMHILFRAGRQPRLYRNPCAGARRLYSSGRAYNLDNNWVPVKKGDYIFMGAYSLQAGYGVGREAFSYIYSKDCNRDVEI